MVISVRTERGANGLEVVKHADSDEGRARLAHEAAMLRRAAHPGVVEVVDENPPTLRLRHAGTPLSRLGPLAPDHATAIVKAVAEVLDALHRQGIVHRRVEAGHVVVSERGRPRLCGFAEAGDGDVEARAGDVAALGRLFDHLLDTGADARWSPAHRGVRAATRRKRATAAFRAAAAAAQRPDAPQRPTAKQFALALADALPGLELPTPPSADGAPRVGAGGFAEIPHDFDPTDDLGWTDHDLSFLAMDDDQPPAPEATQPAPPTPQAGPARWPPAVEIRTGPADPAIDLPAARGSDWRLLAAVAVLVLVAGIVGGSALARAIDPFGGGDVSAAGDSPTTTAGAVADDETSAPTPPTLAPHCAAVSVPGPDADGDGCPEPVVLDGRVATIANVDIELGDDGDLVVVVDHDCDGEATAVVLRPGTGEVFVFEAWSLAEQVEIGPATDVDGARELRVGPGACPEVLVRDAGGDDHVVAGP